MSGMKVKIESSSHWYGRDGTPQYTRPNLSKPGEFRSTTLRDARKEGLVPSVTSIISDTTPKPNLVAWKIEQAILAALTLPRLGGESVDQFAIRVAEDARETSSRAANLGTRGHRAIEDWISVGSGTSDVEIMGMLEEYAKWHNVNVKKAIYVEQPFCKHGYGGCVDLVAEMLDGTTAIIDFKTQRRKPGEKMVSYKPDHPMQLAAYAHGMDLGKVKLLNVLISTNPDDLRIEVKDWTKERRKWTELFLAALDYWCKLKDYDPRLWEGE